MAVEIVVLSGARQGDRLLLEARQFRAGDDPACEVFFDPENDASARDRGALFRLADDGWWIEPTGAGDVYVNQEPVVGKTRIRSGDLVRLSERGPDFSFGIVTRATVSPGGADRAAAVPPAEPSPPSAAQAASGPPSTAAAEPWRHAFWAVVVLAVCVLFLVPISFLTLVGFFRPDGPPTPSGESAVAATAQPDSEPPASGSQRAKASPEAPAPGWSPREPIPEPADLGPSAGPAPRERETGDEPGDVWSGVGERVRDAVYLIQVEVGDASRTHSLPFATCCAIGEDTLLISAREACFLTKWRKQDGYTIWATHPAEEIRARVQDIRVHRDFAKLAAEQSGDWIFVNLGLVTVEGKLPKKLSLAAPEELSGLNAGLDVACFGFTFEEVDKILDTLEPRLTRGKIYDPSLFQLKAKIPANAYGSPIVDARGKIIGVYGNPAPEDAPVKDLHYATVVDPAAIDAWFEPRDAAIWVDPPIPETPSGP